MHACYIIIIFFLQLVGIVKLIDESKRRHLKELFREIDKNGDGYVTNNCVKII